MSEQAVTVLISRNVRAGSEADFERTTRSLMQVAASFRGFLGAQLVHPGEDPDIEDTMYHVVLAFDTQAHLDAWQTSPERRHGLTAAAPFIQGTPSVKPMSGLGLWFRTSQPNPPRWKVAVVTWLGICPTVYLLFWLTGDLLQAWDLLPRTIILTAAVVVVMTWAIAPQLTRFLRPWLFSDRSNR